jgi:hypothetical protein
MNTNARRWYELTRRHDEHDEHDEHDDTTGA